jgi:hypothetical protein
VTRLGDTQLRAVGLAAAVVLLSLTGCGAGDDPPSRAGNRPSAQSSTPTGSGTSDSPGPTADPTDPTSSPGDLGTSSPSGDLTDLESLPPDGIRTVVPAAALLDAATVRAIVGGSWRSTRAQPDPCGALPPPLVVAARSAALTGAGGTIVETVATHRDGNAAAAVRTVARRLQGCGWVMDANAPVGPDSASLTQSTGSDPRKFTIVAGEGVTVAILGAGPATRSSDKWSALVDVAIGTSCLAAPDGCH